MQTKLFAKLLTSKKLVQTFSNQEVKRSTSAVIGVKIGRNTSWSQKENLGKGIQCMRETWTYLLLELIKSNFRSQSKCFEFS